METTSKHLVFVLHGFLFFASCKKHKTPDPVIEQPTITQSTFDNSNLLSIFNNLATPLETFTVDLSDNAGYTGYTCNNGTKLYIGDSCFLDPNNRVATGIITIETKDILSKKDMILNNAFPVSNGQLLVSGGELYLNAKQGNNNLRKNPNHQIYVVVPTNTVNTQMGLFTAGNSANLAGNILNWQPVINTNVLVGGVGTAINTTMYGYSIPGIDSVHWTNCDYFYTSNAAKTTCTANISGSFNDTNTMVFISMTGQTVLAKFTSNHSAPQIFQSYTNSIPVGENYTIGAIGFDGTNYFYASQQVTMVQDMIINLPTLNQVSKTQLLNNLAALL